MSAEQSSLPPTSVRFFITTDVDPGAIPRILEYFSVRGIIPDLLKVSQYKQTSLRRENLCFDIHVSGLSDEEYQIVLNKINEQVGVQNVRMESFVALNNHKQAS